MYPSFLRPARKEAVRANPRQPWSRRALRRDGQRTVGRQKCGQAHGAARAGPVFPAGDPGVQDGGHRRQARGGRSNAFAVRARRDARLRAQAPYISARAQAGRVRRGDVPAPQRDRSRGGPRCAHASGYEKDVYKPSRLLLRRRVWRGHLQQERVRRDCCTTRGPSCQRQRHRYHHDV
jgi:hypothetical protein